MNVDANPVAVTRHMQENLCQCQKLKITVISGFRTKIVVVAKYRAKITVHCRGFWLPSKNYCGGWLPYKVFHGCQIQSDIRTFGITGDWKTMAVKAEGWVEAVTEGGRRFMAAWRQDEEDAARYRQEKR